jgi:hypothetical protein
LVVHHLQHPGFVVFEAIDTDIDSFAIGDEGTG